MMDILRSIFKWLDPQSILRVRLVCKEWHRAADNNIVLLWVFYGPRMRPLGIEESNPRWLEISRKGMPFYFTTLYRNLLYECELRIMINKIKPRLGQAECAIWLRYFESLKKPRMGIGDFHRFLQETRKSVESIFPDPSDMDKCSICSNCSWVRFITILCCLYHWPATQGLGIYFWQILTDMICEKRIETIVHGNQRIIQFLNTYRDVVDWSNDNLYAQLNVRIVRNNSWLWHRINWSKLEARLHRDKKIELRKLKKMHEIALNGSIK